MGFQRKTAHHTCIAVVLALLGTLHCGPNFEEVAFESAARATPQWFPKWLPSNCVSIKGIVRRERGDRWLRFDCPGEDLREAIRPTLKATRRSAIGHRGLFSAPGIDWWSSNLSRRTRNSEELDRLFVFYTARRDGGRNEALAFERQSTTCFYFTKN